MKTNDAARLYGNVGTRTLQKFLQSPEIASTLTPEQLGGMSSRVDTARWSPEERIVYDAVQEGYTNLDSLPVATGLDRAQVEVAVESLTKRGYLKGL